MSALAVQEQTLTIAQVAERTEVSAHTLRYSERIGLLDVGPHASGHRRFTEHDVDRLVFIGRLRATAMPITEIQRSFALVAADLATEDQRLGLLHANRSGCAPASTSWRQRWPPSRARSSATTDPAAPNPRTDAREGGP